MIPQPPVLLITDRAQATAPLDEVVAGALKAGCRWILLREKDLAADERIALLRRLVEMGDTWGAAVMVSADVAAAKQAGAAGVHLPAGGDPIAARQVLGPRYLIGVSAHSLAEAQRAQERGAGYVTLSPIFATASKPEYGPALGLDSLRAVCSHLDIPVIALAGIGAGTARACLDAGASGVAVMGGVMRAQDTLKAMRTLLESLA